MQQHGRDAIVVVFRTKTCSQRPQRAHLLVAVGELILRADDAARGPDPDRRGTAATHALMRSQHDWAQSDENAAEGIARTLGTYLIAARPEHDGDLPASLHEFRTAPAVDHNGGT
ncbi:hypothetical protein [Streptomyces sp. NPDC002851]